jgi:hypothetical protein
MEKNQKEKRCKTNSDDVIIDGLPPLRGMFISPEFSPDNMIPPVPEISPVTLKVEEQELLFLNQ